MSHLQPERPSQDEPARKPAAPAWRRWGIPVVVLVAVTAAGVAIVTTDDTEDTTGSTAWQACKEKVETGLMNPATAEYGPRRTTKADGGTGKLIAGEVKAENAFGTTSSLLYECSIDRNGTVTNFEMAPKK